MADVICMEHVNPHLSIRNVNIPASWGLGCCSGSEGIPSWSPRLESLLKGFSEAYKRVSPDFQTLHGYGRTPPGRANLNLASSQIAERFRWGLLASLSLHLLCCRIDAGK